MRESCSSRPLKEFKFQNPKFKKLPINLESRNTQKFKINILNKRKTGKSSDFKETMKSADSTPDSSVKSSSTVTSTPTSLESENRDSYYFPGCRRDANCNCEICIASINATLDLMPQSNRRSSFTKLSASKHTLPRTPISFDSFDISTPISRVQPVLASQPLDITGGTDFHVNKKRMKKEYPKTGTFMVRLISALCFYWAAEYGFPSMLSGILQPKLTPDMVRNLGEKSLLLKDLNQKLIFLKEELSGLVDKDLTNSCYVDSSWKIDQDGLLLNSRTVLYGSMTEEVSIWGWPLQTGGLLISEFSSRSFTILSGRVTQWKNGEINHVIWKTNSSWVQQKLSASAVQLDPNTWILEYRQSSIMQNARLVSAALQFLKLRLMREFKKVQQDFWLLSAFGSQYPETEWSYNKTPT